MDDRAQPAALDVRAAAAAFRSERYIRVDDAVPPDPWSPIAGFYRAGDGRWIQLHTNFPHHRDGVLRVLGCADDRAAEIGRASWRERVCPYGSLSVVAVQLKKKKTTKK